MLQARHDIHKRPRIQDLEIQSVLRFLGRSWRWLLVSALSALALGVAVVLVLPARYEAVTTLVLDSRRPQAPLVQAPVSDDTGYVDTQIAILQSDLVLRRVLNEFRLVEDVEFQRREGIVSRLTARPPAPDPAEAASLRERAALDALRERTRVERQGTSYVAEVGVRSADPEKAALLANAIARTFIEDLQRRHVQVTERTNVDAGVRVISPALRPLEKAGPKPALILGLALFVGLGAGAAGALLREVLDQRLRTVEDVEDATGIECVVLVPRFDRNRARPGTDAPAAVDGRIIPAGLGELAHAAGHPGDRFTEASKLLLGLILERQSGLETLSIGFAAPAAGIGCSTLAANSAILAAQAGLRTLLIDADARSADLSRRMAPSAVLGGPDLAAGRCTLDEAVWRDATLPLHVLPLPVLPPQAPSAGARIAAPPTWLAAVLAAAEGTYDYVVVDLPPLLSSGDARALARAVEGLVLVAEWSRTRPRDLAAALRSVPNPESRLAGAVLNKVRTAGDSLY